ncbi:oligopeptide/dipeptide ABC transporter membrane protein, partial [mine drainage metagenome]
MTLPLGADKWGRDVGQKVLKGTQTSVWVGLVAAFVATFIGTVLGALAGYYGRGVDDLLNGFYGVLTSIPYLLLVFAVAAVFQQKGVGYPHPDSWPDGVDGSFSPGSRRISEASHPRIRSGCWC